MRDPSSGTPRRDRTPPPPASYPGPLLPALHRVVERRVETDDVVTLSLEPLEGPAMPFRPGQFNMLTAFGVGEVAISMSSAPEPPGLRAHRARRRRGDPRIVRRLRRRRGWRTGAVRHRLGHRGHWRTVRRRGGGGRDRPAPLARRGRAPGALGPRRASSGTAHRGGGCSCSSGPGSPDQIVFGDDLERWRRAGADVHVTVDVADRAGRARSGWSRPRCPGAASTRPAPPPLCAGPRS